MTCLLLSGLITLATKNCIANNANLISVGFKDKETLTIVCERYNGGMVILNTIGYFNKKDNYICIQK